MPDISGMAMSGKTVNSLDTQGIIDVPAKFNTDQEYRAGFNTY